VAFGPSKLIEPLCSLVTPLTPTDLPIVFDFRLFQNKPNQILPVCHVVFSIAGELVGTCFGEASFCAASEQFVPYLFFFYLFS